jgi:cysteine sulfinate desulfinase/cysteine desulfurase-like protein
MNVDQDRMMGQMRFVLGKHNTPEQLDRFLYQLKSIVNRHRAMVPEVK